MLKSKINNKRKKSLKSKIIIITITIYLFNIFTIYSFGKYLYNGEQINIFAKVAKPIFILKTDDIIVYDKDINNCEFDFSISNYDNNSISDVGFKYYIKLESNIINDIDYKLYKNNTEFNINDNKSDYFIILNTDKYVQNFKLKFKVLNSNALNELSKIKIVIYAYQIY